VLVKYDIFTNVVGKSFADLPQWVSAWQAVDKSLLSITDINKDGIIQLAEIVIGQDIIVLATPEIAGLPYVISGLVAAGGLAAALSTADGLLLTIANALSHDLYYKMINPDASTKRRITISKILLLFVAATAAWVTSHRPADILFLVGAAFSLAGSAFFPALVLGIFWKRANKPAAILGMLVGLGVTMYYMLRTYPFFTNLGVPKMDLWFAILPIGSGIFGVAAGFTVMIVVSLVTKAPAQDIQDLIEHVRYPSIKGDKMNTAGEYS
jgi:cation/acetate symporter